MSVVNQQVFFFPILTHMKHNWGSVSVFFVLYDYIIYC